jgi:hypothetical protein
MEPLLKRYVGVGKLHTFMFFSAVDFVAEWRELRVWLHAFLAGGGGMFMLRQNLLA